MRSAIFLGGEHDETRARALEQHTIVTIACCVLAESLRRGAVDNGLQAVERICATLLITEQLISVTAPAAGRPTGRHPAKTAAPTSARAA